MKGLTRRQRQIVLLMAMGKCPKRNCPHVIYTPDNCLQASGDYQSGISCAWKYRTHAGNHVWSSKKCITNCSYPRGRKIFQLILAGKTSKEIAEHFCISYSGVLRHREKMLEQNDCHSMTELIAKYYNLSDDSLPELSYCGA